MESTTNHSCKSVFENLQGMVFYGVPHSSSTMELPLYFAWQCQEINSINKSLITSSSLLDNVGLFNWPMEQLSMDFKNAINVIVPNVIIFAFIEGKSLREDGVSSKFIYFEQYSLYNLWFFLHVLYYFH